MLLSHPTKFSGDSVKLRKQLRKDIEYYVRDEDVVVNKHGHPSTDYIGRCIVKIHIPTYDPVKDHPGLFESTWGDFPHGLIYMNCDAGMVPSEYDPTIHLWEGKRRGYCQDPDREWVEEWTDESEDENDGTPKKRRVLRPRQTRDAYLREKKERRRAKLAGEVEEPPVDVMDQCGGFPGMMSACLLPFDRAGSSGK